MNISIKELKRFQSLASHVQGSNILPAHKYLKIGEGKIVKNVSSSFIVYECKAADEGPLLVHEDDLFGLVSETPSAVISINKVKGKIELNDGTDVIKLQEMPPKTFNEPPVADSEKVLLSDEFWEAVSKATYFSQFIKDMPTYYGYVHIAENCVCAGDGIIAYHYPIEEDVKIIIEGKLAKSIAEAKPSWFSQNEKNVFFEGAGVIFGFVKPEIGWLDIKRLFAHEKKYAFSLPASDITSFGNLSIKLTSDPMVTITTGLLEMNDMLLDKNHKRAVPSIKMPGEFTYNPKRMNTVLKGLDVEDIDFSENGSAYYLSSKDTKATALIAKIKKPQ